MRRLREGVRRWWRTALLALVVSVGLAGVLSLIAPAAVLTSALICPDGSTLERGSGLSATCVGGAGGSSGDVYPLVLLWLSLLLLPLAGLALGLYQGRRLRIARSREALKQRARR